MSTRLERLIRIDAAIRGGGYPTVRTFMATFEVGERTVRADLAFMRDRCRAPLQHDRRRGGYRYTEPTYALPTVQISEGELLAFFLGIELTRHYLGTAFEEPLRAVIGRLAATLSHALVIDLHQLAEHSTIHPGSPTPTDPALLLALFGAVRDSRRVAITYFTATSGERHRRVIEPYHLYNVRGNWQVIAFDHRRGAHRTFLAQRIEAWEVLAGERFVRDPAFAVQDHLARGFLAEISAATTAVAIRFDPQQARYIRDRHWHPSQTVEEHPDGALTLHFQSGAFGEIGRWVLTYGAGAEVLAPPELRDQVATMVAGLARRYGVLG